jgi:hypothetical protein
MARLFYNKEMKHAKLFLTLGACVYFWYCAKTYADWHLLDGVNLIFHEAGHSIFFFMGEFVKVAAGSAFQVLVPFLIALYFLYTGQRVSSGIASMWAGQSLLNVSVYARDAEAMILPLLGGDSVGHDWQYMLGRLGMLDQTQVVAGWILAAGIALILMGSVAALYFAKAADEISG